MTVQYFLFLFGRSEPRLFSWSGADLKFDLEPEPIFLGSAPAPFLANEKQNDLKMFIFIVYIF